MPPLPRKPKVTSRRKLHWRTCCLAPCTPAQIKVQRGRGQRERSCLWPLTGTDSLGLWLADKISWALTSGRGDACTNVLLFIQHSAVCLFWIIYLAKLPAPLLSISSILMTCPRVVVVFFFSHGFIYFLDSLNVAGEIFQTTSVSLRLKTKEH